MTDTVEDWIKSQAASMMNQGAWMAREDFSAWIARCRLDLFSATAAGVEPGDAAKMAILGKIKTHARPAVKNLLKLAEIA